MKRKQFLGLVVVLAILLGVGLWVQRSEDAQWQTGDQGIGRQLVAGLTLADVAQVQIAEGQNTVTLKRVESGWVVAERNDFPADIERIRNLVIKLAELRIVQTLPLSGTAKNQGTVVELKNASGVAIARLTLGHVLTRTVEQQAQNGQMVSREVPSGRHVIGTDARFIAVVNDPLSQAEATPATWLTKDVFGVESPRLFTFMTDEGRTRFAYGRDSAEGAGWKFIGSSDEIDLQKAHDLANALAQVRPSDVNDPGKPDAQRNPGRSNQIKVETFDHFSYLITIGNPVEGNLYPLKFSVSADVPATRVSPPGETAADKEKEDKAFEARIKSLNEKLAREKKFEAWTYLVDKAVAEPLLRERSQFLPEKKPSRPGTTRTQQART